MTCSAHISLRPVEAADESLLVKLYGITRAAELALVQWEAAQLDFFLRSQFAAQTNYYLEKYPAATHSVIVFEGAAVGRLYVDRREHEIRILDLAFLDPPAQADALGEPLLVALQDEARAARLPLNIHLEPWNPTLGLFMRMGFVKVSDNGAHALYEWAIA